MLTAEVWRRAWVQLVGQETAGSIGVVGIGATSGKAALKLDLKNVIWAENPGIEGFVDSIMTALLMTAPL